MWQKIHKVINHFFNENIDNYQNEEFEFISFEDHLDEKIGLKEEPEDLVNKNETCDNNFIDNY